MKTVFVALFSFNRPDGVIDRIIEIENQSYKKWKLFVFDDCSINSNFEKIENYIENKKNENIKLIRNDENQGLPKQINKAINLFLQTDECNLFTWISDDNFYLPNFLSILINAINNRKFNQKVFSYSAYEYMEYNEENKLIKHRVVNHNYRSFEDLKKCFYGLACFMWAKSLIREIGYYDEDLSGLEDLDYLYRTFKINKKFRFYNPKVGCVYVNHNKNLTNEKKEIIEENKKKFEIKHNIKF